MFVDRARAIARRNIHGVYMARSRNISICVYIYICTAGSQTDETRDTLGDSLQGRRQGYWSRNANPPRAECVLMGGAGVRFLVQTFLSCVPGFRGSIFARDSFGYPLSEEKGGNKRLPLVYRTGKRGQEEDTPPPLSTNPFEVTIERLETSSILSVSCSAAPVCFFLLTSDE